MAGTPVVSVIVPTYNRRPLLEVAVRSVLAQTFTNWELIIIDDGSTDGTVDWLNSLAQPRIRVIQQLHSANVSALRNIGLRASQAPWIAFLDDDDAWQPEKLERQLHLHDLHPEYEWSYTGISLMDAQGASVPLPAHRPWRAYQGEILMPLLRVDAQVVTPAVMVRRELVLDLGGFDESLLFSEDYDLWFRLARRARCGVIDQPLTIVRNHLGSRTAFQPGVNIDWMRVYAKCGGAGSGAARALCRQRQAYHAVLLARQYLARREFGAAGRALAQSLRLRPLYPWAWRTAAEAAIQRFAGR